MPSLRDSPTRLALAALTLLVVVPAIVVVLATPVVLLWLTLRPETLPARLPLVGDVPAVGGVPAAGGVAPLALLALFAGVGLVLVGRRIGGASGDLALARRGLALARLRLAYAGGRIPGEEYRRRRARLRGDGSTADEE